MELQGISWLDTYLHTYFTYLLYLFTLLTYLFYLLTYFNYFTYMLTYLIHGAGSFLRR